MKSYILLMSLLLFVNCKKENKFKEIKTYYDTGEIQTMGYIDEDSLITGLHKYFYKSGKIKVEGNFLKGNFNGLYIIYYENGIIKSKIPYVDDIIFGEVFHYYTNGEIEFKADYINGITDGKETFYHKNGIIKHDVIFKNGKPTGDTTAYDENSEFDYYIRYSAKGNAAYRLDVDSLGNVKESPWKFHITSNIYKKDGIKTIKHNDSLELNIEIANPPSCKEVIYTKINGVTKDSVTISDIKYDYTVLPTDLGNNKLEIFIDYYCTDYELKSDYFTLDFEVVKDSLN